MKQMVQGLLLVVLLFHASCRKEIRLRSPASEERNTGNQVQQLPAAQQIGILDDSAPPALSGQNNLPAPLAVPPPLGRQLSYVAGVPFDVGDLNGNETVDGIFGNEFGNESRILIHFDGAAVATHELRPFPGHLGGVYVALGDVNCDGFNDIIAGAGPGGGPHVKVFSGTDYRLLLSFFAYGAGFDGGVRVAAGDVVGEDGCAEIVTGAGWNGGPHVKVFSQTGAEIYSFFAFNPAFNGGIFVAAGDVNRDGVDDILAGADATGGPHLKAFDGRNPHNLLLNQFAQDPAFLNGIRVSAADTNGDGFAEMYAFAGQGTEPQFGLFDLGLGISAPSLPFAGFDGYRAGLYPASTIERFLIGPDQAFGNLPPNPLVLGSRPIGFGDKFDLVQSFFAIADVFRFFSQTGSAGRSGTLYDSNAVALGTSQNERGYLSPLGSMPALTDGTAVFNYNTDYRPVGGPPLTYPLKECANDLRTGRQVGCSEFARGSLFFTSVAVSTNAARVAAGVNFINNDPARTEVQYQIRDGGNTTGLVSTPFTGIATPTRTLFTPQLLFFSARYRPSGYHAASDGSRILVASPGNPISLTYQLSDPTRPGKQIFEVRDLQYFVGINRLLVLGRRGGQNPFYERDIGSQGPELMYLYVIEPGRSAEVIAPSKQLPCVDAAFIPLRDRTILMCAFSSRDRLVATELNPVSLVEDKLRAFPFRMLGHGVDIVAPSRRTQPGQVTGRLEFLVEESRAIQMEFGFFRPERLRDTIFKEE